MSSLQDNLARFHQKVRREQAVAFIDELLRVYPQSEVYFVGGMVRDAALGKEGHKDFDIVVRNVSPERLESLLGGKGKVSLVGKHFGVFKFSPHGAGRFHQIDVALPRREHSIAPGGYRDFDIQSDAALPIEEDLSRRDFTVNAMAWDWKASRLKDPFGGLDDLESRQIRAVGDPKGRFEEDYSRVLRGLRFACQLGFDIELQTWKAIVSCMSHINDAHQSRPGERLVPYEVIAGELLRTFVYDPPRAFGLYEQSGGFEQLMPEVLEMKGCPQPEVYHAEGDVWRHTQMALECLISEDYQKQFGTDPDEAEVVVAILFHDIGKPRTLQTPESDGVDRIRFDQHDVVGAGLAKTICTRLKLSSPPCDDPLHVDPDHIWWLVKSHLIAIHGDVDQMRNRTVEKYFIRDPQMGQKLLKLMFADGSATLSTEGEPTLSNFYKVVKRIEGLRDLVSEEAFARPLVNGHEVMDIFGLEPGPRIGELLDLLLEEQLGGRVKTREEAIDFLKEHAPLQ